MHIIDTTHTIYYRGHWLRVRRSKKTDGSETEMLSIRCDINNHSLLSHLTLVQRRRPLQFGAKATRATSQKGVRS